MMNNKKAINVSLQAIVIFVLIIIFIIAMTPLISSVLSRLSGHYGEEICKLSIVAKEKSKILFEIKECPPQYSKYINQKIMYTANLDKKFQRIKDIEPATMNEELMDYVATAMARCYTKFRQGKELDVTCWPCHYLYNFSLKADEFRTYLQTNTYDSGLTYFEYLNYSNIGSYNYDYVVNFTDNYKSLIILFSGDDNGNAPKNRVVLINTNYIDEYCEDNKFYG